MSNNQKKPPQIQIFENKQKIIEPPKEDSIRSKKISDALSKIVSNLALTFQENDQKKKKIPEIQQKEEEQQKIIEK